MKKEGKTKRIIFGIIGFIIVLAILAYFVIMPLYVRYDVQQTCNYYGEGFKAVKTTDKISVEAEKNHEPPYDESLCCAFDWYCLGPNGQAIVAR